MAAGGALATADAFLSPGKYVTWNLRILELPRRFYEPRPVTPRVRCCRTNLATTRNKGVALECLAVQRLRNSEFRGC